MRVNADAKADVKRREAAVQKVSSLLVSAGDAGGVRQLLAELRPSFASIPKAKTAKIVRQLLDSLAAIPGTTDVQLEVCKEQVRAPSREHKHTYMCDHFSCLCSRVWSVQDDREGERELHSLALVPCSR